MMMKAKCDNHDGHVLMVKYDNDGDCCLIPYTHIMFVVCRGKSLFIRLMACEHERVNLLVAMKLKLNPLERFI